MCIRCTTISRTDNPVPTEVIWKLNGSDILSYPSGTFVYTSGAAVENMLVVVTPTPEFSGLYSCAVRESPAVVANRAITVYPGLSTRWAHCLKLPVVTGFSNCVCTILCCCKLNDSFFSLFRVCINCLCPGEPCGRTVPIWLLHVVLCWRPAMGGGLFGMRIRNGNRCGASLILSERGCSNCKQ